MSTKKRLLFEVGEGVTLIEDVILSLHSGVQKAVTCTNIEDKKSWQRCICLVPSLGGCLEISTGG